MRLSLSSCCPDLVVGRSILKGIPGLLVVFAVMLRFAHTRCSQCVTLQNYLMLGTRWRQASTNFDGGVAAFQAAVSSSPTLVNFHTTWCAPCQTIAPKYEALTEAHGKKVRFINVNVEDCEEVSALHDIRSIPTYLGFKDGHLLGRIEGAQLAAIEELLVKLEDPNPLPAHNPDPLE